MVSEWVSNNLLILTEAEVATTILAFAALALRQIEHPVKNGAKRQKSRK